MLEVNSNLQTKTNTGIVQWRRHDFYFGGDAYVAAETSDSELSDHDTGEFPAMQTKPLKQAKITDFFVRPS